MKNGMIGWPGSTCNTRTSVLWGYLTIWGRPPTIVSRDHPSKRQRSVSEWFLQVKTLCDHETNVDEELLWFQCKWILPCLACHAVPACVCVDIRYPFGPEPWPLTWCLLCWCSPEWSTERSGDWDGVANQGRSLSFVYIFFLFFS